MEAGLRELVQLIVAVLLAFAPSQAVGVDGRVSGVWLINGLRVPLTHVYASASPDVADPSNADVRVLLSEVPLDEEAQTDALARLRLARERGSHIIEVTVGASGVPQSGVFFAPEVGGMVSVVGQHVFSRDRFDASTIAGHLSLDRPRIVKGVRLDYEAAFIAPVARRAAGARLP